MHPLDRHYVGGIDEALTSFGLEKTAIAPEQRAQMIAASRARPKGIAGIQAASATAPVPNVQMATTGAGAPMPVGGPGMAPGFARPGLDLDTPQHRRLARSMTGVGSIPGQAAIAERQATAVPMRYNLPNKLAELMLPVQK